MTVWKFPIDLFKAGRNGGRVTLTMPEGARPVLVWHQISEDEGGEMVDTPMLWVEVDETAPTTSREFHVVDTGGPVPEGATHIGSTPTHEGVYVWHIYEVAA